MSAILGWLVLLGGADVEADAFEPVILQATLTPPDGEGWGSPAIFWFDRLEHPSGVLSIEGGKRLCVWAPPGTHRVDQTVTWARIVEGQVEQVGQQFSHTITIRGPPKPPDPVDPDNPDPPPPTPTKAVETVLILREQGTDSPEESAAILTLRSHDQFARPPPRLMVFDRRAAAESVQQWVRKVPAGFAYPFVFFIADDGTKLDSFELGTDPESVTSRLEAHANRRKMDADPTLSRLDR